MKPFKRTAEKVFAWIGNVFLILLVLLANLMAFSKSIEQITTDPYFRTQFIANVKTTNPEVDEKTLLLVLDNIFVYMKGYAIILVVILVLAFAASFLMKKRILSAVLFILLAVATFVLTLGIGIVIYIPYLVAGIILLARKEPTIYKDLYESNDDNSTINYV